MNSISRFLTKRLRLKVNRPKSAVAPVSERSFLGFCILDDGAPRRHIAPKALQRFKARVCTLTRRTLGVALPRMIAPLATYMRGWRAYFGFCQTPQVLHNLDAWIRRRLRMVLWKQWQNGPNRFAQLRKRGVSRDHAAIAAGAKSGYWRMSRHAVAFNAVIGDVLVLFGHGLEVDGITVECHLADDLPPLWADAHQLHHVVSNLITNAHHALREADPPGHLKLTTTATADCSQVNLEVTDSGSGIPQELQRRIFEPFFTTKPQGVGSGLGLPLCRSIIEGHGGIMHLASQPGHGTTVSVTLPAAASKVPSPEATPEPEEPAQTQRGTILLIDDEPGVQRALQRLLQRSGHEITTATNGQEGLEALEARSYEVILCDMRMPGLDGPGFYRELEQRHPYLVSRVIFLTGDVLSPEVQGFFAQVDCPRLTKPFKTQEVRRAIQQVLEAR